MSLTLLEPTTTDSMVVQCANYSKHGIPTGWFASREFKLDEEELYFMNHLSREDQRRIWKLHFDTGRCVPCMIDEWRASNKFPSVSFEVPESSRIAASPQQKRFVEEKMAAIFEGYEPARPKKAGKVQKLSDSDENDPNVLQRLLELILAVQRCLASCFSNKKSEA